MKKHFCQASLIALVSGSALAQGADDCAGAAPISGVGSFQFSTVGATDSGAIASCNQAPSADVWAAWTSASETDYRFSICTTDYDAVLAIYDVCGGTQLVCEDAAGCTASLFDLELEVFGLSPNTTYILQLDGWQGMQGSGTLDIATIAPPGNDDCSLAASIAGTGLFAFDNRGATTDGVGDPTCQVFGSDQIENDVWFDWTAPSTGTFSLATCGRTYLDTKLAVYGAQACPPVVALACDDDACLFQSRLEFPATAGLSYLIRVGSFSPLARGDGFIELAPAVRPPNDDCQTPTPIAGSGPFAFDNSLATTDGPAEASCQGGAPIENDVWYSWIAPANGPFQVTTCGGTILDTALAVYDDATCPPSALVACGGNECGAQSSAVFDAEAGRSYLVRIGSFGSVYRGSGTFAIDAPPLPSGDDCSNAVPLRGLGTFSFDNRRATTDGLPARSCLEFSEGQIHNDVWYRWTAPTGGRYRIETCGTSTTLDTKLAVYRAQGCPPAAPVSCNDDTCGLQSRVSFDATAGSSFLIRLGTFASKTEGAGEFRLILEEPLFAPPKIAPIQVPRSP